MAEALRGARSSWRTWRRTNPHSQKIIIGVAIALVFTYPYWFDWPVVKLAAGYSRWFNLADNLAGLAGDERAALFGGNAIRFYAIQG